MFFFRHARFVFAGNNLSSIGKSSLFVRNSSGTCTVKVAVYADELDISTKEFGFYETAFYL